MRDDRAPELPPTERAFRESLLWRLERREEADALRRLGALLWDLLNESHQWGPRDDPRSATVAEVEALALDLAFIVADLERVGRSREHSELGETEAALSERCACWAGRIALVLADMGHHVG